MTHVLASPSLATTLRRFARRVWEDPDWRSSAIGVLGVLLIHLLLFLLGPQLLKLGPAPKLTLRPATSHQFNIEIDPNAFVQQPPPAPPTPKQFVEPNPDAPENTPDKTNNFGAQNQQVAQEKPTPDGHSERPALEGRKDFQSTQIVSGRLEKQPPQITPAPTPPAPVHPPSPTAPRAEQNPLPGFEKVQGDNPNGFGTNVAEDTPTARPIPNKIEGAKNVPLVQGAFGMAPAIDPKHPRPRPMIVRQQQVRPAILAENKVGTQNMGVTAINAKFNQYGLYLQRMVDAIQLEWDGLIAASDTYPPSGSYVVVRFKLNSEGNISQIVGVENHSTDLGQQMCLSAITNRAPYGEWTEDMKATLNPKGEELRFTFYYQ